MTMTKFTVIIPTRERSDVLKAALKTVLTQNYENLEVIVSDNFSCDDTEDVVASFDDKRIRYINTGKRVGMSQNWEFALTHVSNGWLTVIGDDDGLLPGALEKVAEIIRQTGAKAIRSATCSYGWPCLIGNDFGSLGVPVGSGWEKRSSNKWLERVMMGKSSYTSLPVLYNGGFVDFEVLKKIKENSGAFFCSMSPDVYMAFAISSVISDYIYLYEPLAINGASIHSGGTCAFSKKKKDKSSPSEKFLSEPNIPFHEALPLSKYGKPVTSIQIVIYESYLQSECLRKSSEFKDHQKQLGLILASSGNFKELVADWGNIFADKHTLNIDKARFNAKYHKLYSKVFGWPSRFKIKLGTYIIRGTRGCPLRDVYEASIVAGTVRAIEPSRFKIFLYFVKSEIKNIIVRNKQKVHEK